jgi:hypothetical protein
MLKRWLWLFALSCSENLSAEAAAVAAHQERWELTLSVLKNQLHASNDSSFDTRIATLDEVVARAVTDMHSAVAAGKRVRAQITIREVSRRVDRDLDTLERDVELASDARFEALRSRPFSGAEFLSVRGGQGTVSFPRGTWQVQDTREPMVALEHWVSFCQKTGGELRLVVGLQNHFWYYEFEGRLNGAKRVLEEKEREVERLLLQSGLAKKDFVEVVFEVTTGTQFYLRAEVVRPCGASKPTR